MDIKLFKFFFSSIMAIIGIIAIWYLEDIRLKLLGVVLLCWEGFYWYSDNYKLITNKNANNKKNR